ncbi:MAG: 3-phosphoshikimate 1-carboxyvinyltransferase [Methylacidiphilales bacterium]|nr:3-phosphoshikimate 1-carboxyvinyltransferase [Candidatus Methylacidiphilales bacterium]
MARITVHPFLKLKANTLKVPGDKSISHRTLLLAALGKSNTIVHNLLLGSDVLCTKEILKQLGVSIIEDGTTMQVTGVGLRGLRAASQDLQCGNSGTAMRLLTGLLCAQNFQSTLIGDSSLSNRPMKRVLTPLQSMGANINARQGEYAPLVINPVTALRAIQYQLPIASAQVKSAILFAGLYATGTTSVTEPLPSRSHTEEMLIDCGVPVEKNGSQVSLLGPVESLQPPKEWTVPNDISSAAFFMMLPTILPNTTMTFLNISISPSRNGILEFLTKLGTSVTILKKTETTADVTISFSKLTEAPISLEARTVAQAIDEIPIIAMMAACRNGTTTIRNAQELRVKESDRIAKIVECLQAFGFFVREFPDGFLVEGSEKSIPPSTVNSGGDHRIAMACVMMATRASGPIIIEDTDAIVTSYPTFLQDARRLGFELYEDR